MIKLEKSPWTDEAASALTEALGDCLPIIGGQVVAGIAECWRVVGAGWAVTRLEPRSCGDVLVLVGGANDEGGEKFNYLNTVKALCNMAANIGCVSVETETHRQGIGRMLEGIGFSEVGRKYDINLDELKHG